MRPPYSFQCSNMALSLKSLRTPAIEVIGINHLVGESVGSILNHFDSEVALGF